MIVWVLASIVGLALLGVSVILIGVQINGAGTLNRIDRVLNASTNVVESDSIAFGPHPAQRLFVLQEGNKATRQLLPVIIFVHGGSWSHGNPADYGFIGRSLAPRGHIVVNAGYRLGEDGKYPAMLEDAASAVGWVREHIADYGGDPNAIFLIGHSAGAYNVAMIALEPRWLEQQGLSLNAIQGLIGLAGPYDFLPLSGDGAKRAFGEEKDLSITQPVNFARREAPPMLLLTGDADETVRPRNTKALTAALMQAGARVETHIYPGISHARIIMDFARPWNRSSDIVDRVTEFIAKHTSASAPVQARNR